MPKTPRIYEPNVVYEITTSTIQGRYLLRPGDEANDRIAGVVGRAQVLYPAVRVYGAVALSTHIELLVSSPLPHHIPAFIGFINGNISKEIGDLHNWKGKMWDRPAKPIPVVDGKALLDRFEYLLAQGCKEHLVESPTEWPGFSSLPALLGLRPVIGTWHWRDQQRKARRRGQALDPDDYTERYEIKFSRLPGFESLPDDQYAQFVLDLVTQIEHKARQERERTGIRCLGVDAILRIDPHYRPKELERSPAPICHASTRSLRKSFRQHLREIVAWFRDSAEKLKQGILGVVFPPYCFPPRFPMNVPEERPPPARNLYEDPIGPERYVCDTTLVPRPQYSNP